MKAVSGMNMSFRNMEMLHSTNRGKYIPVRQRSNDVEFDVYDYPIRSDDDDIEIDANDYPRKQTSYDDMDGDFGE